MRIEHKIKLKPVRDNGTFKSWQMSENGGPFEDAPYPTLTVPKRHSGGFEFKLVDAGNITFSANPIYVQKGATKPSAGVDSQIVDIHGQNTKVLTFNDTNKDAGQLHYVLNFNHATQLDPIIENGGGTVGGEEPPPPPPPPPPGPQGPGATAGTESTQPSSPGLFGNIDAVSIVIGLVVGFLLALVLLRK
jgi:hypothetical protein